MAHVVAKEHCVLKLIEACFVKASVKRQCSAIKGAFPQRPIKCKGLYTGEKIKFIFEIGINFAKPKTQFHHFLSSMRGWLSFFCWPKYYFAIVTFKCFHFFKTDYFVSVLKNKITYDIWETEIFRTSFSSFVHFTLWTVVMFLFSCCVGWCACIRTKNARALLSPFPPVLHLTGKLAFPIQLHYVTWLHPSVPLSPDCVPDVIFPYLFDPCLTGSAGMNLLSSSAWNTIGGPISAANESCVILWNLYLSTGMNSLIDSAYYPRGWDYEATLMMVFVLDSFW